MVTVYCRSRQLTWNYKKVYPCYHRRRCCSRQTKGAPNPQLYPNAWNQWIVSLHGKRGIKIADEIKFATSWLEDGNVFLGYPGKPGVITRVLKSGRGNRREVSEKEAWWRTLCCWLWRWRKGGTNCSLWVTSRSWKRPGRGSSARISRKECSPAGTLILASWDLDWTC